MRLSALEPTCAVGRPVAGRGPVAVLAAGWSAGPASSDRGTSQPARGPAATRRAAVPLVLLVALLPAGWQGGRLVAGADPIVAHVASPAVTTGWGRIVVLGSTASEQRAPTVAAGDRQVVEVAVRLVGVAGGRFDPATVALRLTDGTEVPVTPGAPGAVQVPVAGTVQGVLGFAVRGPVRTPVLVVRDPGGGERRVVLRAGQVALADPARTAAGWSSRVAASGPAR